MEESVRNAIKQAFEVEGNDIKTYSPLTFAYIGDCILDLIVRTVIVEKKNKSNNDLHKEAIQYVNARTQARMTAVLEDVLTQEELEIYKRGKNAKTSSSAKNASLSEYHKATGLEALLGYLYMTERMDRAIWLVKEALNRLDMQF